MSSFRRISRVLPLAAAASVALIALSACSSGASGAADASGEGGLCPGGRLSFGIEPFEAPDKLEPAYQVLATALSEKLGCPVEVQIVEDYSAEVLAMQNGKLDLGQFGPLGFVFASQKAGAEPIASFGLADGSLSSYTAGIWVPKDSPVQSVADLKGKGLALGSVGSTSGDALPRFAIREAGMQDADVNLSYAGGHPEALLALTNGTVDAAQINSQTLATAVAEGTFEQDDYRQIWESAPIPNDPITIRPDASPELKAAVRDALLGLSPEDVEQVGAFLDVTPPGPLVPVTVDTYRPLFDLARTMGLTEQDV